MSTCHVYSNRHISNQVENIKEDDTIVLENALSKKRWSLYFKVNNIDERNLNINYLTNKEYFELNNITFDVVVGNPPYVDGTEGESNIYQKIVCKAMDFSPESQTWIIPTSWFLSNTSEHKSLRENLFNAGLKEIILNPMDSFDNASVKTCTVVCKKEYFGKVKVVTSKGHYFIPAEERGNYILPVDNEVSLKLLNRIAPKEPYKFLSGTHSTSPRKAQKDPNFVDTKTITHQYPIVTKLAKDPKDIEYLYGKDNEDIDSDKWRIAVPYLATGYANGDMKLGAVGVINKGTQLCGYYKYINVDSHDEALTLQKYFMSKFVRYILHYTRTSRTLDAPQVRYIPKFNIINTSLTDNDIYNYFNLSTEEIKEIEGCDFTWTS
jgi:hypothetical protein